ncbi:hypothetical protein HanXRQr2_Chr09g0391241 [Helianthus annuus]|uniref:Uncharacterized protein n=1 Tax=Helianthus annuus TaxID=4232 RepID=A0A9K3N9B0_HELAN|nr:hypothetical protein HanXRQr2_Chr09g0391241 [Helianthus annuus]
MSSFCTYLMKMKVVFGGGEEKSLCVGFDYTNWGYTLFEGNWVISQKKGNM